MVKQRKKKVISKETWQELESDVAQMIENARMIINQPDQAVQVKEYFLIACDRDTVTMLRARI